MNVLYDYPKLHAGCYCIQIRSFDTVLSRLLSHDSLLCATHAANSSAHCSAFFATSIACRHRGTLARVIRTVNSFNHDHCGPRGRRLYPTLSDRSKLIYKLCFCLYRLVHNIAQRTHQSVHKPVLFYIPIHPYLPSILHPTASIARSSALTPVGNLRNGRNKALGDKKASVGLSERAVPECLRVLTRCTTLSSYHHLLHAVAASLLSTLNVLLDVAAISTVSVMFVSSCRRVAPCQALCTNF